ncbi:FAD-binding domain-containing protein [Aspergillus campestris IBT 28561]|uniref:FAD-binding domain-containing protein n=1 Tax=Aspergillus campestris (strain IBT 28561) TaxID=1392248 RepID=A0A2I1DEZ1_ASPC2|nr:FAD-binding domain-containing protein [Aspergillus campestris IBT 28561]PKY08449.1 FAD-binding domain-containing protein [Aspergillus campestris IBT 28561]
MQIVWRNEPDMAEYEAARWRRVFNQRRPERFPRAVVRATCQADVIAAVQLAIKLQVKVAVRSGGHSFEVWSVQDDSILIDLGDYKGVEIRPAEGTLTATPSTTSKEINELLAVHGMFFPSGHCPDVGLGGFLLQGGMGWNCANWGWGSEFVEGLDIVTAQGTPLYCDSQQHSDLYWAARGAGPSFPGLVTRFHLRAMPSRRIWSSGYIFPAALYRTAFTWALSLELDADTEITAKAYYQESQLCFSVFLTTFEGTPGGAAKLLTRLHASRPRGTLVEWCCQPETLDSLYESQARSNPQGHRYATDNGLMGNEVDVVSILAEPFLSLPHPKSLAFWTSMQPWSRRRLPDMALSLQADHYFAIYTVWEDEADDDRCRAWLKQAMRPVEGACIGAYLGDSEFANRMSHYWDPKSTVHLRQVRQAWDPEGRIAGGFPNGTDRSVCRDEMGAHHHQHPLLVGVPVDGNKQNDYSE